MMSQDDNVTQKDLLKLLVDQAQHNATREELNRVEDKLSTEIKNVEDKLTKRIDDVEVKLSKRIDDVDNKIGGLKTTIIVTVISSAIALGGLMVALAQMIKP